MNLKLTLAALAVGGMLYAVTPAQAGDVGLYIAPKLVLGIQSLDDMKVRGSGVNHGLNSGHDGTAGIGAALGFDFYPRYMVPARIEVELMHMGEAEESGSTENLGGGNFSYSQKNSLNSLFVNAYFDLHNSTMFTPYAGIGLGTAWITSKGSVAGQGLGSNTETNVAWNAGLGVAAELTYNASLDFGYRYASFGTAKTDLSATGRYLESDMAMHQFMLNLRFTF